MLNKPFSTKEKVEQLILQESPNAFNGLSRTQKDRIVNAFIKSTPSEGAKVESFQAMRYAGPIPHPDLMEGFKRVDESLPDKIMSMANEAQNHFISKENKIIDGYFDLKKSGQAYAFYLAVIFIIGSFGLVVAGKDIAGYVSLAFGIVSIAGMFLGSKTNIDIRKPKDSVDNSESDE